MEIARENKTLPQERAAPLWMLAHFSQVVLFEELGGEKTMTVLLLLLPDGQEAFPAKHQGFILSL